MKAATPAVPEYYADLYKIVDALGTEGDEKAAKRNEAKKQLLLYSVPQVTAFLKDVYPMEEAKRRKKHRITLTLSIIGIIWCIVVWGVSIFLLATTRNSGYSTLLIFPGMVLSLVASCIALNKERIRGMAQILPDYAEVQQVPLLIDALHFWDSRTDGKARLCTLLLLYSHSDEPPLDNHQMRKLEKELKQGFEKIITGKGEKPTDGDIAFLAAVVIYFERELSQGKTIPKSVMPILQRFAATPASDRLSSSEWTMLKSATEACIANTGAGR